jgi:hypothetical protein
VREAMQAYQELQTSSKAGENRSPQTSRLMPEAAEGQSSVAVDVAHQTEECTSEGENLPLTNGLDASSLPDKADVQGYLNDGTSPEQIVEILYWHIFGRPPDPSGFADQVRRLKERGFHQDLPSLIRDFVTCEEARARFALQRGE